LCTAPTAPAAPASPSSAPTAPTTPTPPPSSPTDTSPSSSNTSSGIVSAAPAPESDRIHSTDIAFKPNSAGWGYSKGYAKGFDSIFKKKEDKVEVGSISTQDILQSTNAQNDMENQLQAFELLSPHDKSVFVSAILKKYPEFNQ
jgi:hypothetical protein